MIRTIVTQSYGRRRQHIAVNPSRSGWVLQVAHPTEHGYRFDAPIAGPFKRRKDALDAKRALDAGKSIEGGRQP